MYEGVREKYNSRTEYNYFGMEKPLAYEIVDMARRFDQQKEELLDLVDMQARLLDKGRYHNHKPVGKFEAYIQDKLNQRYEAKKLHRNKW